MGEAHFWLERREGAALPLNEFDFNYLTFLILKDFKDFLHPAPP